MKTNILIMTWINRLLIVPFIILSLLGIMNNEFILIAMIAAFVVGVFQSLSFLITLFYLKNINKKDSTSILLYFILVISYFILIYLLSVVYEVKLKEGFICVFVCLIPFLLSVFWTFILESLKTKK